MKSTENPDLAACGAIDYLTADFLDAYEEVERLYQRTMDERVKAACLRIKASLDASLDHLVKLGTRGADRWKETKEQLPN